MILIIFMVIRGNTLINECFFIRHNYIYEKIHSTHSTIKCITQIYRYTYTLTNFTYVAPKACHAVAREVRVLVMARGVVLTRVRRALIYCCISKTIRKHLKVVKGRSFKF